MSRRFILQNASGIAGTILAMILLWLIAGRASADVTVTPDALTDQVREYIRNSTPMTEPDTKLSVEVLHVPFEGVHLKGDRLAVSFSDSRTNSLTFRTIVQVTLATEMESRTIGVPVKLGLDKPVWVTTRMVRAGSQLTSQDVTLQRRTLDMSNAFSLGKGDTPTSYVSRVNLSPGSLLDTHKLAIIPTIARNEDVHLIMDMSSGVQVSMMGKAMEDGVLGRKIRVSQTNESHRVKIYTGEVVNHDTVLIRL